MSTSPRRGQFQPSASKILSTDAAVREGKATGAVGESPPGREPLSRIRPERRH